MIFFDSGLLLGQNRPQRWPKSAQKSIKRAAPSSENWKSVIKQNVLVRPGLRKKMLRKSQFFTN